MNNAFNIGFTNIDYINKRESAKMFMIRRPVATECAHEGVDVRGGKRKQQKEIVPGKV